MPPVNTGRPWTPEEVQTLRRLYPTHGPLAVAKALGRTVKAVYRRAEELKVYRVVPLHLARALVADGVPRQEAAKRFGVRAYDVQRPRRRPRV